MSDTRFTYCPGCNCRILPSQDVVGVKGKAEDGSDWLWHRACLQWKEMRDGIKITPDPT